MVQKIKKSVPIFFTKMDPTYLFEVGNINSKIPSTALHEAAILCVSAIASADSFVKRIHEVFHPNHLPSNRLYIFIIIGEYSKYKILIK